MTRRLILVLAPGLLAALGLAGPDLARAQAPQPVRYAYAVQTHMANLIALPRFAERYGLKLEAVPMRRYADLQLALTTNQVDFASLGYVNIGLMADAGFEDWKAIAGVFTGAQGLTLHKDVKAGRWKDLEGLRLGTAPNSYAELLFKATAKLNGVDLAKVKTVSFTTGGPPVLAALKNRDIDGFVFWEPNNAEAALGGYGVYSSLDIGANETRGVNGLFAVNSKYAAQNPDVVVAMVKALVEATAHLNAHLDEYAQVAQRATGSALPVIKESIPRGNLDHRLYQREGEALLNMLHETGITKKLTTPAVAQHFDYQYVMKATGKSRQELGGR